MIKDDNRFEQALQGAHIPVLTLDNKWHRLFNEEDETPKIKKLETQVNDLVKHQGKLNTEMKDLKKIKNNLMKEIVESMDTINRETSRKTEENTRLINEINERLEQYQEELLEIPGQIDEVNTALMLETMDICYNLLLKNTGEIEKISTWIQDMRTELKKNVLKRQEMEIQNVEVYSYLHDIFGPKVVELFDIQYDIESKKQDILNHQRAVKEKEEREKFLKEKQV